MLSKLLNMSRRAPRDRFVSLMARIYGTCPACGRSSFNHKVWEFASAQPSAPDSQSPRLEAAIVRRDWPAAAKIREFRGNEAAIAYSFLRCPLSRGIVLLRLVSYSDMWVDDRVTDRWVLTGDGLQAAAQLARGKWKGVGEQGKKSDA